MCDFVSSGDVNLDKNICNWLTWNIKGSKSYEDVYQMAQDKKWKELKKIMNNRLAFGTAGLRGKMGAGLELFNSYKPQELQLLII